MQYLLCFQCLSPYHIVVLEEPCANTQSLLTLYCLGHSNELGDSIPPLMSRTFEPTIVNICFDWPLACGSQFHHERVGTWISSFQQILRRSNGRKSWVYQVAAASEILFILHLDDMMDAALELKNMHTYKIEKHTCEDQIQLRALFSFISNQNLRGLAPISSWII